MSWNGLNEREKELVGLIEHCGVRVDNSRQCLDEVMRKVGAKQDEESFVLSRIQLKIRVQQALNECDSFIGQTEQMLKDFEEDDLESERIARYFANDTDNL